MTGADKRGDVLSVPLRGAIEDQLHHLPRHGLRRPCRQPFYVWPHHSQPSRWPPRNLGDVPATIADPPYSLAFGILALAVPHDKKPMTE